LLREKDRTSKHITVQNLSISYEDDYILVVEKPTGMICLSDDPEVHSLARTVYDYCRQNIKDSQRISMDQMVVHRLGFDTSGLLIFAKTLPATRNLHMLFRTRHITRQYEALVVGHVKNDHGLINLPLMRDYEHPPYMRISTKYHQQVLLGLDPQIVGKKLMEAPKSSLTHYQVLKRVYWNEDPDLPVSRLTLTSITGRTHQLNCHLAALGHPIVRDTVYGFQGTAAPHGGLEAPTQHPISDELQTAIANAAKETNMCVHAKLIRFVHPVTGQEVEYRSTPPF
jgi:RluA family pseudouridine synthase